jgi:hypothetical protein
MNSLCWMLLYFLHLVHKLKWSGCLACCICILLLDLLSRHVSQMAILIGCACCRKRRKRRKRSLPARAKLQNLFHHHPQSSLLIMALRWVDSDQPYLPKSKLDNQHYVCFDRHAIVVTTIGDDRNKSFYLPRKHPSIYNTKDLFLHAPPPADHNIMLPPTARQHAACLFWSPLIAVPTVVDHRNNLANMH